MAFLFSFYLAIDKCVIGRVVTAIRLTVAPVLDQGRCRQRSDEAAELVLNRGPFLVELHNTRMHGSTRVRNWTLVSVCRKYVSRSDKSLGRGSVRRAD